MTICVVTGCQDAATARVTKHTQWSVWEYRVCARHKADADNGAPIHDNPDGRTITMGSPAATTGADGFGPTSDIDLPVDGGRLIRTSDDLDAQQQADRNP